MLHFRMDMPFYLMVIYGSIMIIAVLLLRGLLKNKLPKFVFPALWGMVLLRLLVPFALSSPLSLPLVPENPLGEGLMEAVTLMEDTAEPSTGTQVPAKDIMNSVYFSDYDNRNRSSAKAGGSGADGSAKIGGSGIDGSAKTRGSDIRGSNADGSAKAGGSGADDSTIKAGGIWAQGTSLQYIGTVTAADTIVGEEASGYARLDNWVPATFRWQKLAIVAYFLGAAVTIGILGRQKYSYSKKLKNGLLMEHNETVNEMLRSRNMGHILVFTSDEIASPMACGLLNPRIYLPTRMNFQDKELLGNIFAHETMHIKRRDNWVKAVMLAALCLNWYNPLVWIMAKCLSSDLEAACDEAVLRQCGQEGRKEYARCLLSMAVTGGRTTLLYSAFSKTEVEKRISSILRYKKMTVFALIFSVLFMAGSAVVFATGGQAPFSSRLTSYCAGGYSRWGVRVSVTRDVALGKNAEERAEEMVFAVLREDTSEDPEIIGAALRSGLSREFGVEKRAFEVDISLCLSPEEVEEEYLGWGMTKGEDGFWLYQGEKIRVYSDKMLGSYQSREEGTADVTVERNRLGEITAVTVLRQGDSGFDERTRRIEEYRQRRYGSGNEISYGVAEQEDR